jgi:hypothetical protein
VAASEAMLALGGPAERQLLLYLAEEPRTVEPRASASPLRPAGCTALSILDQGCSEGLTLDDAPMHPR